MSNDPSKLATFPIVDEMDGKGPHRLGVLMRMANPGKTSVTDSAVQPLFFPGPMKNFDLKPGQAVCSKLPKQPLQPPRTGAENPHRISTKNVDVHVVAIKIGVRIKGTEDRPTIVGLSCNPENTRKMSEDDKTIFFEFGDEFADEISLSAESKIFVTGFVLADIRIDIETGIMVARVVQRSLTSISSHSDGREYDFTVESFNVDVAQEELQISFLERLMQKHYTVRGILLNEKEFSLLKALAEVDEPITVPRLSKKMGGVMSDAAMHCRLDRFNINNLVNKDNSPIIIEGQELRPMRWSLPDGLAAEILEEAAKQN